MSTEVGAIHYDLDLDTSKFERASADATNSMQALGGKLISTAKMVAVVAGAALTAAVGKFVIGGGITRALNIEDAQAKLRGLGHDAESVTKIMDSALKSVKGTAFGLDAAATAAASAVAAGIEPGTELTRVLSLTGDTATITGRQFNEAGSIINKVLASNRLSMEEVNQLQDAGLPILSMLGKEYGKTAIEMREMVSSGEVDSKRFLNALEKNIGGAALASGNTTRGAWMNMQAAMSRVGAAIVKDIIPKIRDAFGGMTKWFDANSNNIVSSIKDIIAWFGSVGKAVVDYLGPKISALWKSISEELIPAIVSLWEEFGPFLGTALVVALGAIIDIIRALSDGITFFIPVLGAAGVAYLVFTTITSGVATAISIVSAAQAVWNAVLMANPIVLLISLVAGLATGLALLIGFTNQNKDSTDGLSDAQRRLKETSDALTKSEQSVHQAALDVSSAKLEEKRLTQELKDTIIKFGPTSLEAKNAADRLAVAHDRTANAIRNETTVLKDNQKAHQNSAGAIAAEKEENKKQTAINNTSTKIQNQINQWGSLRTNLDILNGKTFSYTVSGKKVGGNASGTDYWRGGPTWVGERGPEIVNLPRGAQVIPNDKVGGIGSTTTATFTGNIYLGDSGAVDAFFARLSRNSELASKGMATL